MADGGREQEESVERIGLIAEHTSVHPKPLFYETLDSGCLARRAGPSWPPPCPRCTFPNNKTRKAGKNSETLENVFSSALLGAWPGRSRQETSRFDSSLVAPQGSFLKHPVQPHNAALRQAGLDCWGTVGETRCLPRTHLQGEGVENLVEVDVPIVVVDAKRRHPVSSLVDPARDFPRRKSQRYLYLCRRFRRPMAPPERKDGTVRGAAVWNKGKLHVRGTLRSLGRGGIRYYSVAIGIS